MLHYQRSNNYFSIQHTTIKTEMRCALVFLLIAYYQVTKASKSRGDSNVDDLEFDFFSRKLSQHSKLQRLRHSNGRNGVQVNVPDVDVIQSRRENIDVDDSNRINRERCMLGLVPSNFTWKNDECSLCSCNRRQPVCEKIKCTELFCENKELDEKCCRHCPEKLCTSHDGRRFPHGSKWHHGDCTYCKCRKGEIFCTVEDCQLPNCPNPVKIPGQCCPVCLTTSCHSSNGTLIPAGEVWKEGLCVHCYCAGGEKKCANEKCPYINCTDAYRPENSCCSRCTTDVVDCVVSDWMEWDDCPTQECGGGMRKRLRNVLVHQKNGGEFCPHTSEAQMCPQLACDVLPYCPLSEWSTWSSCTATCGHGKRLRQRKRLTNKATMIFLLDCSQTKMQDTISCYAGSCTALSERTAYHEEAVYDDICYDAAWGEWGECSETCGIGFQSRRQVLVNQSQSRGHLCRLLDETRVCKGTLCDKNKSGAQRCEVSEWNQWSTCSGPCGRKGHRLRERYVLHSGNGACPKLRATKPCKNKLCRSKNRLHNMKCISEDGLTTYREGEEWFVDCWLCTCKHKRRECKKMPCS